LKRLILWDFDGTLASRRGETGWSLFLAELLDVHHPDCSVTADQLRPFLQDGFPWHTPGTAPIADIAGAEAFGIPAAVLVGNKGRHVRSGAGIEAHLAQFEESEAAATEFTLGFTQGARASSPRTRELN
jgi:hypothetical protein